MKHAREDYNRIQDPAMAIPVDEPVFLIRGQDVCGPDTLRYWANRAMSNGAKRDIVDAARDQAAAMETWQRRNKKKVPDLPSGEPSRAVTP